METGDAAIIDGEENGRLDDKALASAPPAERPSLPGHGKQTGHKRSLSGSILSSLSFLRMQSAEATPPDPCAERKAHGGPDSDTSPPPEKVLSPTPESAMMLAQRVAKQRKRKGSLRKTALLGPGRLKAESRERRNSLLLSHSLSHTHTHTHTHTQPQAPAPPLHLPNRHDAHLELPPPLTHLTCDPSMAVSTEYPLSHEDAQPRLSLSTARRAPLPSVPTTAEPSRLASPIVSPTSQSYTSTTDDDEALTLPDAALNRLPMPSPGSYFPAQPSIPRRRSSKGHPSPLSAIPVNAYGTDEEYDYSHTEWWGWVVLMVTWIVFVVGMGSCFGLWSWAWAVGASPYAPPELEDDATLPIVGYYPALIILTGVMAWIWVVVAWVGMKYFKHAKMAGEDG